MKIKLLTHSKKEVFSKIYFHYKKKLDKNFQLAHNVLQI